MIFVNICLQTALQPITSLILLNF